MVDLWEANVKSFKVHIRKIGVPFKYNFEEFATLLARIEACLNSRPISPRSENPSGHFLTVDPILAPLDPTTTRIVFQSLIDYNDLT